jgi:ATP-dependent helicase/DNAse subunit B
MNGLLIDDEKIVTAIEKDKKGEYAPKYENKGYFITDDEFEKIFEFIENKLKSVGETLYGGDIEVSPTDGCAEKNNSSDDDESGACKYCEFQNICRIGGAVHKKVPKLTNKEIFDEINQHFVIYEESSSLGDIIITPETVPRQTTSDYYFMKLQVKIPRSHT